MRWRALYGILALFVGIGAAAQPAPLFDVDDFVDPEQRGGALFIVRVVAGVTLNATDALRPLQDDVGFVHIANSFYWSDFQVDYKRSEIRAQNDPIPVQTCSCSPRIYFPSTPSREATPAAPHPGSKDTIQVAWYRSGLRFRATWSVQKIDTPVTTFANGAAFRLSGDEQSIGLEADTRVRIGSRNVFGSLRYVKTERSGTTDDRTQNALTYTNRFPARSFGPLLVGASLTVGAVSGRGATGLSVVNPALEAFWRVPRTGANLHLVWSPQSTRSGDGWTTAHQIAVFADRALFVKLFGGR